MSAEVKTIAGMKVVRLLGKGGMSEVYEVENVNLGSRHAVKLYSCAHDSAEVRKRFEVEGKLLARLNHPRIVKVVNLGVDAESGKPYFVMDLVCSPDGNVKSLADVQAGEADEKEIGNWYDDIREGLAYIHGKGVVHRDLKLQNILVGPDGHAVITDFGISRIFNPDDGGDAIVDPVQTIVRIQDGKRPVMGSLGYMAPELEMGATATDRSDWYALGVIVFKLLTGTWCDSRTNVADILSSYDRVWMEILPLLLHSNPEGRKCLSYAGERERFEELRTVDLENRIDEASKRSKVSGMFAVVAAIAALVLGFVVWRQSAKLCEARDMLSLPTFASTFAIPADATEEETEHLPSRGQFELALCDARNLTSRIFEEIKEGSISLAKARDELKELSGLAKNEEFEKLFSRLPEGFEVSGEMPALSMLLGKAAERLK